MANDPIVGRLMTLRHGLPGWAERELGIKLSFPAWFRAYREGWSDAAGRRHCLKCFRVANVLMTTAAEVKNLIDRVAEGDRAHYERLAALGPAGRPATDDTPAADDPPRRRQRTTPAERRRRERLAATDKKARELRV